MQTPAEQYRALVARLESIHEQDPTQEGVVDIIRKISNIPKATAIKAFIALSGMGVTIEIIQFLMKNKSQLSPQCQGALDKIAPMLDPEAQATAPSTAPTPDTPQPTSPEVSTAPKPTSPAPGAPAGPGVGKSAPMPGKLA
jgi:hypothetical protein